MKKIEYNTQEVDYSTKMVKYFEESFGTTQEKLQNFPKYISRQALTRFITKYELFKKVLDVHGSVVEGGVYHGSGLMTFAQVSSILEPVNFQRKIIGFDTFAGFEDLTKEDEKSKSPVAHKGGLAADTYEDLLRCAGLYDENRFIGHMGKIELVKGDVKKTIPAYLEEHPNLVISLLYLDFDVYEPTKIALDRFLPRMPPGAIVAFDELDNPAWPGETLAYLEKMMAGNHRLARFCFDPYVGYVVL